MGLTLWLARFCGSNIMGSCRATARGGIRLLGRQAGWSAPLSPVPGRFPGQPHRHCGKQRERNPGNSKVDRLRSVLETILCADMNRTGVVVVTYNSGEVIERCLDSCANLPAVVVDNASQDNTVELVRRRSSVKLIANPSNRGFAGAANQGVAALDTEMILLLNPDVELQTSVDALAEACGGENVGLATGKLVDS